MHLTNFSLNKNSDKFILPEGKIFNLCLNFAIEEFYKDSTASKRLLTNIYKQFLSKGRDVRHLKRQISELTAKTIIAIEPYLKNSYHCFINQENTNPKCF
jgi:tubulin polyglutamylase TTLL6/13